MAEAFIEAVRGSGKAESEKEVSVEQVAPWFGHSVERDHSRGVSFLPIIGPTLFKPAQFWEARLAEVERGSGFADRRRQETQRQYDREDRKRSERKREVARDARRVDERIQASKRTSTKQCSVARVLSHAEARGVAPLFVPSSGKD